MRWLHYMFLICSSTRSGIPRIASRIRSEWRGTFVKRKTFPQLPWQEVDDPKTIVSNNGDTILADGWYGLARKVHDNCICFLPFLGT